MINLKLYCKNDVYMKLEMIMSWMLLESTIINTYNENARKKQATIMTRGNNDADKENDKDDLHDQR